MFLDLCGKQGNILLTGNLKPSCNESIVNLTATWQEVIRHCDNRKYDQIEPLTTWLLEFTRIHGTPTCSIATLTLGARVLIKSRKTKPPQAHSQIRHGISRILLNSMYDVSTTQSLWLVTCFLQCISIIFHIYYNAKGWTWAREKAQNGATFYLSSFNIYAVSFPRLACYFEAIQHHDSRMDYSMKKDLMELWD